MHAIVVNPEGDWHVLGHPTDEYEQYNCVKRAVGAHDNRTLVERVRINVDGHPLELWVDEEGLLKSLPYNVVASFLASRSLDYLLVGTAYVTARDMTPMTDDELEAVKACLVTRQA